MYLPSDAPLGDELMKKTALAFGTWGLVQRVDTQRSMIAHPARVGRQGRVFMAIDKRENSFYPEKLQKDPQRRGQWSWDLFNEEVFQTGEGLAMMGVPHRRISVFNDVRFGGILKSIGWPDYSLWEWGGWGEEAGGGARGPWVGGYQEHVQGWHHRQNRDGGPLEPPILDASFAKKDTQSLKPSAILFQVILMTIWDN